MRLCRYQETTTSPVKLSVMHGDKVHDVTAVTDSLPAVRWPYPPGDLLMNNFERLRSQTEAIADTAVPVPVSKV